MEKVVGDLGVTAVQAKVLAHMNNLDSINAGELGRMTALDSATLTGVLDRLEKMALISRTPTPEDRRVMSIRLSKQGKTLAGTLLERMPQANETFLASLTDAESSTLRQLLKQL